MNICVLTIQLKKENFQSHLVLHGFSQDDLLPFSTWR